MVRLATPFLFNPSYIKKKFLEKFCVKYHFSIPLAKDLSFGKVISLLLYMFCKGMGLLLDNVLYGGQIYVVL